MKTLFVSALPFKITEDEIRNLFGQYGTVEAVSIFADWENASFEPYAQVTMSNAEAAIMALDGFVVHSTYLRVNLLVDLQHTS